VLDVTDVRDAVAVLTLDRSDKKNALSIALRDRISDALDALARDEGLRCLVLTGRGNVFCAGFDLSEFAVTDAAFQQRLWASSDRYHATVARFPVPTVAALNGPAIAGGFDLAVLCDLRVAADTATFSHPERRFGDVVYGPLHDLVGGAVARDLCFTGRVIDAVEAQRLGVVNRVVPASDVLATAMTIAGEIAEAPREVLVRTKAKALRRAGFDATAATLDL
jgi:enoyl-CoA hydratase/carnithine racemase